MSDTLDGLLPLESLQASGNGPLYLKLRQALEDAIHSGRLAGGAALPAERDLADYAGVSRVTLRKAVDDLVSEGLLVRRHGSGTFVVKQAPRVEQPLSRLTSFTEDMVSRGLQTHSNWLERGLFHPSPEERMRLGIAVGMMVARLDRLRTANDMPLAIERASVSAEFVPDPAAVSGSLYAVLEQNGAKPIRAIQRISACNVGGAEAALLEVAPGAAGLSIERIAYLASGRVVEFTRSLFRGDAYDFVAELALGQDS